MCGLQVEISITMQSPIRVLEIPNLPTLKFPFSPTQNNSHHPKASEFPHLLA